MPSVYFHVPHTRDEEWLIRISKQTPGGSCTWGDISATNDSDEADYIIIQHPPRQNFPSDKLLWFPGESPVFRSRWDYTEAFRKYPYLHVPVVWWVSKPYDDLIKGEIPEKSKLVSWVTSDKGIDYHPIVRKVSRVLSCVGVDERARQHVPFVRGRSDGHRKRMIFLQNLVSNQPELVDIYGRGDFSGSWYHGEIEDKWLALAPYKYSVVVENYSGKNYFSEKLADALLSWSMPIYWGCTNLDEFIPENSYVNINIDDPDAAGCIEKIVQSGAWERNLSAISEARQKILNEYQLWPTVENQIGNIEKSQNDK
jgi:hypothetical protein